MPPFQLLSVIAVPLVVYLLWKKLQERKRNPKGLPLPPGPPAIPFFGNAHQILGKNMLTVLDRWANEYGE